MNDTTLIPSDLMREIARTMNTDSASLLHEFQQRWQALHTAADTLPSSVRGTFTDFLGKNGPPLTDAITLRQQLGPALSFAADMMQALDAALSKTF